LIKRKKCQLAFFETAYGDLKKKQYGSFIFFLNNQKNCYSQFLNPLSGDSKKKTKKPALFFWHYKRPKKHRKKNQKKTTICILKRKKNFFLPQTP
jgi:hypothetical protein